MEKEFQEDLDGNVIRYVVDTQDAGQRLDIYLGAHSQDSRSHIKNLIEKGRVLVGGSVTKAGYTLKAGEEISVMR